MSLRYFDSANANGTRSLRGTLLLARYKRTTSPIIDQYSHITVKVWPMYEGNGLMAPSSEVVASLWPSVGSPLPGMGR